MNEKKVELNSQFWIVQKGRDSIWVSQFDSARQMEEAIEDIVVGLGEMGKPSNIIAQSMPWHILASIAEDEKNDELAFAREAEARKNEVY